MPSNLQPNGGRPFLSLHVRSDNSTHVSLRERLNGGAMKSIQ